MSSTSTRISRHIRAPRAEIYRALLDARSVAAWMVPKGMTRSALAKLAALVEGR